MAVKKSGKLKNKTAIVTGGGTGLGKAIAVSLAVEGATVVIASRTKENLDETVKAITSLGGRAFAFPLDLTDMHSIQAFVDSVNKNLNSIDILVNNSGTASMGSIEETTSSDWDSIMGTNLKGLFFLTQGVVKRMQQQDSVSKIINITSVVAHSCPPNMAVYNTSKAALEALTKTWAKEFAPKVLVNNVAPGLVPTNLNKGFSDELKEQIIAATPMGRLATPDDIANACLFYATSDFITGQTIVVDGGRLTI